MVELTALSSRSGGAIATFLNFYVLHGEVFKRQRKLLYIFCIDNSLLFPTVKEFSNRLTVDKVVAKIRYHLFETLLYIVHALCFSWRERFQSNYR